MVKREAIHQRTGAMVWIGGSIALILLAIGVFQVYQTRSGETVDSERSAELEASEGESSPSLPQRTSVAALGRIEPEGEVVRIGGPVGDRISRLEVAEGQEVIANQVLAYLESHGERKAERNYAVSQLTESRQALTAEISYGQSQIQEAQSRIEQADRPKALEMEAQQATIRRLEAELALEREDLARFEGLFAEGAIAEQQLDEQATTTRRIEEDLNNAKATLVQLEESRTTDLALANNQLRSAQANLSRAQIQVAVDSAERNLELAEARLERTVIRAPKEGRVLRILTEAGEAIANDGILDLGNTRQMVVIAEVYETDVSLVKIGQTATINSRNGSFEDALTGKVTEIGWQIFKNDVLDDDPAANADARVVEVTVQLDNSETVEALTNLQVDVRIDVTNP